MGAALLQISAIFGQGSEPFGDFPGVVAVMMRYVPSHRYGFELGAGLGSIGLFHIWLT